MRVLIASCIRQKPEILIEFLESLHILVKPNSCEYFFILDDLGGKSQKILLEWSKEKSVETETMNYGVPYVTDEDTHHWTPQLVSNVIEMKNKILKKAKGYDYLLFVDSDTYLHPKTLTQLLNREKDIITEISWTQWYADDARVLPNAWFYQKYGFPPDGLKRLRNESLIKVGGFGGLYLISRKALEAGVSFTRVKDKPEDWGEDRHFAVRAQSLGFDLWCDTTIPSFHIYRMSDLPRLQKWKSTVLKNWLWGRNGKAPPFKVLDCRWGNHSELRKQEFIDVIDELDGLKTVYPRWSRCWEYPYSYLQSALEEGHRILDAGCGNSSFKFFLEGRCREVHCIDKTAIELPEDSSIIFKQCDIAKTDYPDDYFDRIFCIGVLEHAQQPPMKYIREMLRILKIGGMIHLTLDFNRWETKWKFRKPQILDLCQELKVDYPPEPIDLLRSEDHSEGKTVGEGLSVLGFTILKTEKNEEEETGIPTVLISVPHTGNIRTELASYLLNVVGRNALNGAIQISVDLSWGMPVDSNRNSIVKKFLETNNDWLLTIDSDIEPPKMTLETLLSHNKKVVGAICWSSMRGESGGRWEKHGIPYPVVMAKNPEGGWNVDRKALASGKRLIECDSASTACVLIHRDVLSVMDPPLFKLEYDEEGLCNAGEDFTFFEKVRQRGFHVFVDAALQCGHYKIMDIQRVNQLLAETEITRRRLESTTNQT